MHSLTANKPMTMKRFERELFVRVASSQTLSSNHLPDVMAQTQMYREGGWGWFVVLSAFLAEVIIYGSLKGLGVLIIAMKDDFQTDLWVIGSIDSLHFAVQFVLTPVASSVARKVGSRVVIIFGGLLYGIGLLISMTTSNVGGLAISIILISGSGSACILSPTRAELAFYFHERFALASFVALCGAPVGMILYGPATQVLLETYGWRGTMLLMSDVGFHLILAGMLVRRPKGVYAAIPGTSEETGPDARPSEGTDNRFGQWLATSLGLDILINCRFILLACLRMLYNVSYGGVMVYLVPNGQALGLGTSQASFLTTAFGAGSLAGLSIGTLMLHTKALSLHVTAAIAGCVTAMSLAQAAFIQLFVLQMVNSFAIGFGLHIVVEVVSVMERFLPFPDERYVIVLGWMSFLSGVSTSIGDVTSGWLHHVTGSFHGTFFLYSSAMLACMLLLLVDYLRLRMARSPNGSR
ncbi:monocarboxylate transporter 13-like [Patiria miniata]|uniref:Major facilitator superfamily (MFS) profile domain-containing protein n=1 Tax=Patiria miniata TaxID=46514 RepID=A0A913ZNE8_PATMI|nr:monocarboxylate transporter 13-like [Patiria miniata]